ncbi:MAG: hypothetical protein HYX76_13770 [Acidobacteria bacterium]|nr:hypothetical protein [Acidobacteriota bacterium]
MSLKVFHIVFIIASLALIVFTLIWALQNRSYGLAVVAFAAGGLLFVYQRKFREKARRIGLK